jgi:hypothetical protein
MRPHALLLLISATPLFAQEMEPKSATPAEPPLKFEQGAPVEMEAPTGLRDMTVVATFETTEPFDVKAASGLFERVYATHGGLRGRSPVLDTQTADGRTRWTLLAPDQYVAMSAVNTLHGQYGDLVESHLQWNRGMLKNPTRTLEKLGARRAEAVEKLAAARAGYEAIGIDLFNSISAEQIITSLIGARQLLDVDLAGIDAQLAALRERRAATARSSEIMAMLARMELEQELERLGKAARRAEVVRQIEAVKRARALLEEIEQQTAALAELEPEIDKTEKSIADTKAKIEDIEMRTELRFTNDTVVISPIQRD